MRAVLQLLQPISLPSVNSTSTETINWFKNLNGQLHDRIWRSHEQLTAAFLQNTKAGRNYVDHYNKQTCVLTLAPSIDKSNFEIYSENHRLRPKMLPADLAVHLPLTTNDVRGLWASIEFAAHRRHWESTSNISKLPAEALRRASHFLISRVINHWVRGGKLDYELSISSKASMKDFKASSNLSDPPEWPKFPPQADRPCSVKSWEAFSDMYPVPEENPLFLALIQRTKKQDAPARTHANTKLGTPLKPAREKNDSLASDSDESDLSTSFSSDIESGNEFSDRGTNSGIEDEKIRGASLHGKLCPCLGIWYCHVANAESDSSNNISFDLPPMPNAPDRQFPENPNSLLSTEQVDTNYDDSSEPIDPTPRKTKSKHPAMLPLAGLCGTSAPIFGSESRSAIKIPNLNLVPGPTLTFRLENDQPPELAGDRLPNSKNELVNIAHGNDQARRVQLAQTLAGGGSETDDAFYGDSESAHIASLSSVGKAEYIMHCLARDILRYERVIYGIAELKKRDEHIIIQIKESRQKAISRQRLMEQLERETMDVNRSSKTLTYSEHMREMEGYGMPTTPSFKPGPPSPNLAIQP